jgi:hypothetical protein
MDYRRIDELNTEAELYVMEFMQQFEMDMQGERANYVNAQPIEGEIPEEAQDANTALQETI